MARAKRATKKASPTSKAVTYSKRAGKTLQKVSGSLRGKGIPKTLKKNLKSSQTGLRTLSKRAQVARANLKSKTVALKSKGSKEIKAVAKLMKQRLATANKHLAALKALRKSKKTGSRRKSGSKQDIPLAKWKRNKKKSRGRKKKSGSRKKKSGSRKKKSGSRKKKTGGRKKRGKRCLKWTKRHCRKSYLTKSGRCRKGGFTRRRCYSGFMRVKR
jgi:transcription factor SPN1